MCIPMPFGLKRVCVCAATMPPVRSTTRSRSPSPDEYPSHFEQIRRWRLHGNLRIYFWISMTWVDVAGRRHLHNQFFHTDMQTQLQVYTSAQRLLRRERRTIQPLEEIFQRDSPRKALPGDAFGMDFGRIWVPWCGHVGTIFGDFCIFLDVFRGSEPFWERLVGL